mmetsp:Transcript_1500/g.3602  ORF Transcript_1500/g.3602 Transcript_1500/m.3602 type:complete len:455 (+) Transcript_1500:170-1534(+)
MNSEEEIERRVVALRLDDPEMGAKKILAALKEEGLTVSENRVKKILQRVGKPASGADGANGRPTVERKDSGQGRGFGLFTTANVKQGDSLFSVRPALSVVFEPAAQRVCGFCFATPAASAPETLNRKLCPGEDGSFGVLFHDIDGKIVCTGVDASSANKCTIACGDVVKAAGVANSVALVEILKASKGEGGMEVELERPPLTSCRSCQKMSVCARCAELGVWGWHERECDLFRAMPAGSKQGDTSVIRFLLRWRATKEVGEWCRAEHGKEAYTMVDALQGNIVSLPQVKDIARLTGVDSDIVAKLIFQIRTNAIEIERGGDRAACGLSAWVGYTNHSCDPSAVVQVSEEGRVCLTALRDIAAGEEVTISYIDRTASYQERRETLQKHYAFTCVCPRCDQEGSGGRLAKLKAKKGKDKGKDQGEELSKEEFERRQKAADEAMAALLNEGSKKKKK